MQTFTASFLGRDSMGVVTAIFMVQVSDSLAPEVLPAHQGDASTFIGLGGRIPAPIHSLKN